MQSTPASQIFFERLPNQHHCNAIVGVSFMLKIVTPILTTRWILTTLQVDPFLLGGSASRAAGAILRRPLPRGTAQPAIEPRWNNLEGLKDLNVEVKARIWP